MTAPSEEDFCRTHKEYLHRTFAVVYFNLDCWRVTVSPDNETEFYFTVSSAEKFQQIREEYETDAPIVGVKKFATAVEALRGMVKIGGNNGGIFAVSRNRMPR